MRKEQFLAIDWSLSSAKRVSLAVFFPPTAGELPEKKELGNWILDSRSPDLALE
jgi:hypothetical protein